MPLSQCLLSLPIPVNCDRPGVPPPETDLLKTRRLHHHRQRLRRQKRFARARQVLIRLPVAGHQLAEQGNDVAHVQLDQRRESCPRWPGRVQGNHPAARAQHVPLLAQRRRHVTDIAQQKSGNHRVELLIVRRQAQRIYRPTALADQHHPQSKIRCHRRAIQLLAERLVGQIAGAGVRVEHTYSWEQPSPEDHLAPLGDVMSAGHQPVHQVVARRDTHKH